MVQPNMDFFGEKDFQQLQVIKAMVTDLSMNLRIFGVPTVRNPDGLARSSRNQYLSDENRQIAPALYQNLQKMVERIQLGRRDFSVLVKEAKQNLIDAGFKMDYIEIRAVDTLLSPGHEDSRLVILAAAFLGKTRLIDNIQVNLES
jgi:pantoate--beta-alanine ligase